MKKSIFEYFGPYQYIEIILNAFVLFHFLSNIYKYYNYDYNDSLDKTRIIIGAILAACNIVFLWISIDVAARKKEADDREIDKIEATRKIKKEKDESSNPD